MLKDWRKLALVSASSLFLSSFFVFLAPLPMRYLRLGVGRVPFALLSLSMTSCLMGFQQWQWAMIYFSLSFLIAVYSEMESKKFSLFTSAVTAIGLTLGITAMNLNFFANWRGATLLGFLEEAFLPVQKQFAALPQVQDMIGVPSIISYLPSVMAVALMIALFIALFVFSDERGQKNTSLLKDFRMPDLMIWGFMISLAGTFLLPEASLEATLATNALTVLTAAYFFQGLAVTSTFMDAFNVSSFWRLLVYFLIFLQMFIIVSGIGIMDLWFDFRTRIRSKKNFNSRREEKS